MDALQARDGDAIRRVTAAIDDAWNRGDAATFASHWTLDGIVVSPMGEVTVGRGAIQQDMANQFAGPMRGTYHRLIVTRMHWPKVDVAVVDGLAEVGMTPGPDGHAMPPWTANFTAVFAGGASGEWLLADMRSYTFIQPPTSTAG